MKLDWMSLSVGFLLGFFAAAMLLDVWRKRMDRLRWMTLHLAIKAGIPIEQYAVDLEIAERRKPE